MLISLDVGVMCEQEGERVQPKDGNANQLKQGPPQA